MNLEPRATDVINHLRNQVAEKSEEAATNWSGMQLLHEENQALKKRVAELESQIPVPAPEEVEEVDPVVKAKPKIKKKTTH